MFLIKFHFWRFQKGPKINFWTGKKFKTARNAISRKKIDLFDFTSLFAWTFVNFLARCGLGKPGKTPYYCDIMSDYQFKFLSTSYTKVIKRWHCCILDFDMILIMPVRVLNFILLHTTNIFLMVRSRLLVIRQIFLQILLLCKDVILEQICNFFPIALSADFMVSRLGAHFSRFFV